MATYFVSFMISDDAGYARRYDALMEALRALSPTIWWSETTSFIILSSDVAIDAIAGVVRGAINARTDIAVIGMTDVKSMRVLGNAQDQDIFKLVPFAKKA